MGGFNGSGTYVRYYNWQNDKANGINITASRFDTEDGGFANGLSTCICKDGQTTTTAQIPFASGIAATGGSLSAMMLGKLGELTTGIYSAGTGSIDFASNGSRTGGFTSTGLNGTVIGATTAAAATVTTLAATSVAASTVNKVTITAPATGSTLTIADGKTLTANNTLALDGTDGTTLTFQGTDTYVGRATTDTLTNKTFDTAGTGNVLKINGVQLSTTPILTVKTQIFTSGGTYTPSTGMLYADVKMQGGGGGGGGVDGSNSQGGGGGGSGSYSWGVFSASTIGASQTVTIGAAGAAGTSGGGTGGTGGATSLGSILTTTGGVGGVGSTGGGTGGVGGVGGAAGTGTGAYVVRGDPGASAQNGAVAGAGSSGAGGNGKLGGGGVGAGPGNSAGIAGVNGGGGSGARSGSGAAGAGAAGGTGVVIITEYCSQ